MYKVCAHHPAKLKRWLLWRWSVTRGVKIATVIIRGVGIAQLQQVLDLVEQVIDLVDSARAVPTSSIGEEQVVDACRAASHQHWVGRAKQELQHLKLGGCNLSS